MKDFTLRQFQTTLPWTVKYSEDFRSSPVTHKDFAHALHHVSKAAGKLHGLCDDMDHDKSVAANTTSARGRACREDAEKYLADLVVCALRAANTLPGGPVDLQSAVHRRIEEKNGVKLSMLSAPWDCPMDFHKAQDFASGGYTGGRNESVDIRVVAKDPPEFDTSYAPALEFLAKWRSPDFKIVNVADVLSETVTDMRRLGRYYADGKGHAWVALRSGLTADPSPR